MSYFDNPDNESLMFRTDSQPLQKQAKSLFWVAIAASGVSLLLSLAVLLISIGPTLNSSTGKTTGADLYEAPFDLASVVEATRAATVTVFCGDWSGSGWGIDLSDSTTTTEDDDFPYEIVTNFHVVEECVDGGNITLRLPGESLDVPAYLFNFDYRATSASSRNDLAILMTATPVSTLKTSNFEPQPGDWLMAVGNPNSSQFDDMEGHVTFGRVSNFKRSYNVVVTDTALNHGNSGGPLVNSRGEVVGTNTWIDVSAQVENIAYAIAVPKLCEKLLLCEPGDPKLWGQ